MGSDHLQGKSHQSSGELFLDDSRGPSLHYRSDASRDATYIGAETLVEKRRFPSNAGLSYFYLDHLRAFFLQGKDRRREIGELDQDGAQCLPQIDSFALARLTGACQIDQPGARGNQ